MIKRIESQEEFDNVMESDQADNVVWCENCGRCYLIDYTPEEEKNLFEWSSRKLFIQEALPNRTKYERELMRYAWSGLPLIACSEECEKEQFACNE